METIKILNIFALVSALVIAIVGHEIMHGLAAYRYGDPTAKLAGRLSINPLKHIDPVGTILVPAILFITNAGFLFGWAKPVPVNMSIVLRNGKEFGAIVVSLAGIAYNFTLAILSALLLSFIGKPEGIVSLFVFLFLAQSVLINVVLGVFNLWPIPPLDGANALMYLARWLRLDFIVKAYEYIFPYGMVILILILMTPASQFFFLPVYFLLVLLSMLTGIDFINLINQLERI
ncbi:site-2 protease family protein [Nitratiruptor tergarcus]|uniref:Zn-dependent protease (Includes SpoIVFB) n=1 Tax=Nitratiruptor tergarcus DSM 16512 TaxID=1069081 RepID=A0A1W1WT19_9BACT|nr:site-2 protease family protein [Nitratiruptor tergarcus]SMC09451.1 Zn-dependent protease (includes SpoIVFB) [Nitratiruptor tergarcus DSM 16512]